MNHEGHSTTVLAARKILRPLVKWLIASQITYPHLISLLKSIYVEVAVKDFPAPGKKQTDSRVHLLTGVHRKDVKRLRSEAPARDHKPANVAIGAQLIARWLGDRRLLTPRGLPKALPWQTEDEYSMKSFEGLVMNIAKGDIRPRVVLDELMRMDLVELDSEHNVILKASAYAPAKGQEEKLFFFGKNIQDHINAGAHNLSGTDAPFFDRSVYYDQLSPASIKALAALGNSLGEAALIQLNQKALELQTTDRGRADAIHRMNFGVFNYNEEYHGEHHGENAGGLRQDNGKTGAETGTMTAQAAKASNDSN